MVDGLHYALCTMQDVGWNNTSENNPLTDSVDFLTQERDQLQAELARERDNGAWLKG
jgi:hypothetical protein